MVVVVVMMMVVVIPWKDDDDDDERHLWQISARGVGRRATIGWRDA